VTCPRVAQAQASPALVVAVHPPVKLENSPQASAAAFLAKRQS
jgi:hypothetical protein